MNNSHKHSTKGEQQVTDSAWRRAVRSKGVRLIFLLLVLGVLFVYLLKSLGGPEAIRDRLGYSAVALIVPVQAVVAVSPFPSEIVVIGTTAIYGFWFGAVIAWLGWFFAAFLQYFVARHTARDFDFERVRSRLPNWIDRFPVEHPAFLILARLVPWGPHLVNSAAGVYGISLIRHGWCAAISIVPQALFFSAVGNGLFGL